MLAQLHLVLGEGHVAAVADDVQETQAGQLCVEEGQQVDAARLLPPPGPAVRLRVLAGDQRSQLGGRVRRELASDPAVEERGEVERVQRAVQVRADEHPAALHDRRQHPRPRAAGGADHARLEARRKALDRRWRRPAALERRRPAAEEERGRRPRGPAPPLLAVQRAEPVAQEQRPAKDRPRDGREVLVRVLQPGPGELRLQARVGRAVGVAVVEDRHGRAVDDLPAGPPHPQAEVDLLRVEEEPLVEAADRVERLAPHEQERADRPVALELVVVALEPQLALSEPVRAAREAFQAEGVAQGSRRGGEQAHRGDERAAVVELADAGDPRLGPQAGDELRERAFQHLRVRVEEQQPGRIAGRGGQVARVGEAAVLARDRSGLREVPLDQLAGRAGGAVVHDDEVERQALRVLEQRREAARQPALLVVRDDDDREIVHGRTVASRRGRDSALPGRARSGADARRRARAGRAAAPPCLQLRASPVGEGLRDEGARARSSAAAPASLARRARCGSTSARAATSYPAG